MPMSDLVQLHHLNADQRDIADIIGIENYRALINMFGGSGIWISKAQSLIPKAEWTAKILEMRENGYTIDQISRALELPSSTVANVIKPPKKLRKKRLKQL